MSEKFSIIKLLKSPFSKMFWVKSIMFLFGIGFLAFVAYGVYKAYFKKPPDTQAQIVKIESPQAGSVINFGQKNSDDDSFFDPFAEVYVEGSRDLYNQDDRDPFAVRAVIKLGIRF